MPAGENGWFTTASRAVVIAIVVIIAICIGITVVGIVGILIRVIQTTDLMHIDAVQYQPNKMKSVAL